MAAAASGVAASSAWALGLGRLAVQSALGETLRAEIDVTSLTPEEASILRVRVAPPESYRAAGVDYNAVLPGTQVTLQRRADGRPYLRVTSDRAVQEPFVDVILEITWSTGRLVREYTLLFDPPSDRARHRPGAAPPQRPSISAAPPAAARRLRHLRRRRCCARGAPSRRRPPAAPEPRAAAPAPAPARGGAAARRPGRRIPVRGATRCRASPARTQRAGVSLDQMLVSLFRANPERLRRQQHEPAEGRRRADGAERRRKPRRSAAEARQVIQAQSADFGAYRQRLAGRRRRAAAQQPARQATGKVQAQVDDRKQAAAPAPDKLTLTQGRRDRQARRPKDQISKGDRRRRRRQRASPNCRRTSRT